MAIFTVGRVRKVVFDGCQNHKKGSLESYDFNEYTDAGLQYNSSELSGAYMRLWTSPSLV